MVGFGITSTTTAVAIVDVLPSEKLKEGIGYFSLTAALSNAFGPPLALKLYGEGGFYLVMLVAGILGIASIVIVSILLNYEKKRNIKEPSNKDELYYCDENPNQDRGIWKFVEKKAVRASASNYIVLFSYCLISFFITYYAVKTNIPYAGLFFILILVGMFAVRFLLKKWLNMASVLKSVAIGGFFMIAGFALLVLTKKVMLLYLLSGIFFGFGNGFVTPALNAAAISNATESRKGVAASTFILSNDIAVMTAPVFWGMMTDYFAFEVVFCVGAVIMGMAVIMVRIFYGNKKILGGDNESDSRKHYKQKER
jgi:MFS family permease